MTGWIIPGSTTGAIAVYPIAGRWKDNEGRSDLGVRHALVVLIDIPEQDVDIWAPVAQPFRSRSHDDERSHR